MKSGGKAVKVKKHTAIAIMPITASSFRIGRGAELYARNATAKPASTEKKNIAISTASIDLPIIPV